MIVYDFVDFVWFCMTLYDFVFFVYDFVLSYHVSLYAYYPYMIPVVIPTLCLFLSLQDSCWKLCLFNDFVWFCWFCMILYYFCMILYDFITFSYMPSIPTGFPLLSLHYAYYHPYSIPIGNCVFVFMMLYDFVWLYMILHHFCMILYDFSMFSNMLNIPTGFLLLSLHYAYFCPYRIPIGNYVCFLDFVWFCMILYYF